MKSPWVLFEDSQNKETGAIIAKNPIAEILANEWCEIAPALNQLEDYIKRKKHIFGFVSYEFGLGFEEKTRHLVRGDTPLLWFGVFDNIETFNFEKNPKENDEFAFSALKAELDFNDYDVEFKKIKKLIECGDIYQANLTFKLRSKFWGSPFGLYKKLRENQPVSYSAFLDLGNLQILSLSPELFFKTQNNEISAHPMKGTMARGNDGKSDIDNFDALRNDAKQCAENLMITDLMRNDLARISVAGTVKVPHLFEIEKYPSVFQMISKIQAQLKDKISHIDILKTLSPAGSIVGCPKIRATEIIADCENGPRGIYCGAIGMIKPNGDMSFNVAIRTPIIKNGEIEIGVGSGLVYDSESKTEYAECLLKSRFFSAAIDDFALIETFKWDGLEFKNLDLHLARMEKSATFFEISFDINKIKNELFARANAIKGAIKRVRLVHGFNDFKIEFHDFKFENKEYKICIHPKPINSNNLWLRHKTTNRKFYDLAYSEMAQNGFDEVIFLNENGEFAEGSRSNLFFDFGDGLITPSLKCGALPGILRQSLIDSGLAREGIINIKDLEKRPKIYIGNSLRGLIATTGL